MAFGNIRKKREKKKLKEQKRKYDDDKLKQDLINSQNPEKAGEDLQAIQNKVSEADELDRPRRDEARIQNKEQSYDDVTTELPGMSEERKRVLQESANSQIDSQVQNYARQMAGANSRAGQKGGTVYAQQADIAQKGLGAQNQFQRDLLDEDQKIAEQHLAQYIASLEGKTAEDIMRRQQQLDWISGKQDKNKQDVYWNNYNNQFNKV